MFEKNKFSELVNIATDVLVGELRRRAEARGMTTDELVQAALDKWETAEKEAAELKEK